MSIRTTTYSYDRGSDYSEPTGSVETYVGRVLWTREKNGYDDSDFLALVEDEGGKFRWVEYGSTRYGGYASVTPDAGEDVLARYEDHYRALAQRDEWEREAHEDEQVDLGYTARVVKGRKHVGAEGTVFWKGYRPNLPGYATPHVADQRIGIRPADGEQFFVGLANVLLLSSDGTNWREPAHPRKYPLSLIGSDSLPSPDQVRMLMARAAARRVA